MGNHFAGDSASTGSSEPQIAIIGMSGRFPGAGDIEQFWANISSGVESFATFTDDELIAAGVDPAELAEPNYVRSRPVLDDVRSFDATFFGMSPRDAMFADPQQRLFTECTWEALEMAGYGAPGARGDVGVFAGTNYSLYLFTRSKAMRAAGADADTMMAGNDKDSLATTVSYRLDLRGPSIAVQTFCSTSLVSVHLACAALRRGECDMAVAGGVSIRLPDRVGYVYQEGNQASPDGHVRTFDAQARGSMFGDGVAVVALKRLDRALADRDTVLAVVRGSAVNNDGALKFSYQAPSIDGQRRCISAAIADAAIDPSEIDYVEAHGTATEVGDPMEVAALSSAYGTTPGRQSVLLGSVKPNVGHLDRASGATGLIKVVQSMRHGLIPGTRNFRTPNPEIDFAASPFRVTADATPWPDRPDRPRAAAVSSLGMGGTNAHAIITEAPALPTRPPRPHRWQVLPVSARWAEGADTSCETLATALRDRPDLELADVAWTLQAGRKVFNHRRVVVADTVSGAADLLDSPAGALGRVDPTVGRKLAFVLAGVGEQYPGMVAELYAGEPAFRADVDECVGLLGLSSVDELCGLFGPAAASDSTDTTGDLVALLGRAPAPPPSTSPDRAHLVQPAVFVAEYALARHLMRWGLTPDLMIGYSLGEYVAACLSGVLDLADAVRLVAFRARLIAGVAAGSMLAVSADEQTCRRVLGAAWPALDVAVRTGSQLVLAGPVDVTADACETLLHHGLGARILATSHAYHSRMLVPLIDELTTWVTENVRLSAPGLPYLSNVTGAPVTAELATDPAYWARHMCETVEFGAALENVLRDGSYALLEIGAGQSLGALVRAHPAGERSGWPLVVGSVPAEGERRELGRSLADAIARLWLCGVTVTWAELHGHWQPGRVPLPTYCFDRREYWLEADAQSDDAGLTIDPTDQVALLQALPRLDETECVSVGTWRQTTTRRPRADAAHWLVLDDGPADPVTTELRALVADVDDASVSVIRPGAAFAIEDDCLRARPGSRDDLSAALRHLSATGRPPQRMVHLWGTADGDTDPLRRGLHTLLGLARAAGDLGLPPWSLDIVTLGSHRVHPGDVVVPLLATAIGPCRLIPVEYAGCRTRLIDVDARSLGRSVVDELLAEPTDQVVALRAGRRWVPGYEVLDAAADPPPQASFRSGGTYLVTGGLGGVGLALAERLAAEHRANVVLMGRTPVPPADQWPAVLADAGTTTEVRRRLTGLQRIRSGGHRVITVAGDVSVQADVDRAVATTLAEFGQLNGILHAAGVPAVGLMQFKTTNDVLGVLAPKVAGTLALSAAVRDLGIDFIALFSSTTSATGGGAGQVDYCAANAFLDAYATSDPIPGTHVVSLDWGEWTWNGWTSGLDQYDEGSRQFFEQYRQDFGIGFDQGWRALQRVLSLGEQHVVVSTQDYPTLVAMSRRSSIAKHQEIVRRSRDGAGRHPRPELSTPFVEPQTPAEEAIAAVWAAALGLAEVGSHDNFFELGGNSLVGLEIIASVRTALDVPYLPPHLLYQAPTVAALAVAAAEAVDPDPADGDVGTDATAKDATRNQQQSRIDQRRSSLRTRRTA